MTARRSPYDLVSSRVPTRTATKAELMKHVRELERTSLEAGDVAFAIACLQDVRFPTPATTEVYEKLARRGAQVLVLGRGVHASIAPGVQGVHLDEDDPLGDEWSVLLAGRAFTCLVAQDLLVPDEEDGERSFTWAQTDDHRIVADVYDVLAVTSARGAASWRSRPTRNVGARKPDRYSTHGLRCDAGRSRPGTGAAATW